MARDLLDIVDHPLIAARYFFPRPAPVPDPFVVTVPGAELHGYRTRPARPGARTWLHFHGNGEVVADYLGDWAPAVEAFGVDVVLAEYRGYGGSSGAPTLGAMLEDAAAFADACEVADEALVVYGRSVGAIFAVEVARRRPDIAGLVIESGVADVGERLAVRVTHRELGVDQQTMRAAIAAYLDHEAKLADFRGALLVIHARDDDLVEPHHAELTYDWAVSAASRRTLWFDHGGHNGVLVANWDAYLAALRDFEASLPPVGGG